MNYVNYGAPVQVVSSHGMTRAQHDGPENHHLMQGGEQCECGVLGLGIVRADGQLHQCQPPKPTTARIGRTWPCAICGATWELNSTSYGIQWLRVWK